MAATCWEHWDAETFLQFVEQQAGPGGFVHIDNEVRGCSWPSPLRPVVVAAVVVAAADH